MNGDMNDVIQPKSDQINADTLIGGPMTVKITGVKIDHSSEQKVSISLEGTPLVFRPCKSMSKVLVAAYGADANLYVGKSMTLYRDPKVKWGGLEVGGIRISHLSHIDKDMVMMLTQTRAQRAPHKVKPLRVEQQQTQTPASPENALQLAEAAARKGTAVFRDWWGSDEGKLCRVAANQNIESLKKLAADADGPPPDNDDDAPPM